MFESDSNIGSETLAATQTVSFNKRPFILMWLSLLVFALIGLAVFYQFQSKTVDQKVYAVLQSVAESKVALIEGFLHERYADLASYTDDAAFIELYPTLTASHPNFNQLQKSIKAFYESYGYDKFTLIDKQGKVIYSIGNPNINMAKRTQELIEKAQQTQVVQTQLFIQDDLFHLDFVAPVLTPILAHKKGETEYLGSLVLHMSPQKFILPILETWPTQTKTGHTELLFSNTTQRGGQLLKRSPNAQTEHQLEAMTGDHAFEIALMEHLKSHLSQPKFTKRTVENGDTIFQYHTHLKNLNWVLVSSLNKQEAYADLQNNFYVLASSLFIVLLLVGLLLIRIFRNEKMRFQNQQLKVSQAYFMRLFMDAPVAYQSLNEQIEIVRVNHAWTDLFGYSAQEVIGKSYQQFVGAASQALLKENFRTLMQEEHIKNIECQIKLKSGEERSVKIEGRVSTDPITHQKHTHCVLVDITQQRLDERNQQRRLALNESLFKLSVDEPALDETGLLEMAINHVEAFTHSKIGFVHFIAEDQNEISIGTWSSHTQKNFCTAIYDNHYPVNEAGIWADPVRNKVPKIVNDYEIEPNKKGLPEGHSVLKRFVSIPILSGGLVRMIIGVGNAPEPYDEVDVQAITHFGNEVYQMLLVKRIQLKLAESEHRFQSLFQKAPLAYQSVDEDCHLLEVNESWLTLFGFEQAQTPNILGQPFTQFLTSESRKKMEEVFHRFTEQSEINNVLFDVVTHSGEVKEIEMVGRISFNPEGKRRAHCMLVNVTEQRRAERDARLATKVFANTGEGLMITDAHCTIISVNPAFTDILGYEESDVVGQTPSFLHSGKHDSDFYKAMWDEIKTSGTWQGEVWNRHKSGTLIPEWLTITALYDNQGEVENYIGVFADISKLKASQKELDYLAHHDVLTNLPNRRNFMANLEFVLTHVKRTKKPFAILMFDLDRFKEVNDSYGHAAGDEVLINCANILKHRVRESDMVARLGGDEFVVLIEDVYQTSDPAMIAKTIISDMSKPQTLNNERVVSVGCSIGIALYPQHGSVPEMLMQHVDSALYLAKKKGRGTFEYFSPDMTAVAQQRMETEAELKSAIVNNELRVFYQPQVDLKNGKVKGAEALVRWQHPTKGLLPPASFIAVAEESGLISAIGEWVLYETCRQAKVWFDQGQTDYVYAVNVSPKQLAYTNLFEVVMDVLEQTGLPAECLELEITESGLMEIEDTQAVHLFESLRGLGVRIAIDDFGTGYSSLSYLKSLPIDVLKVDKSFVDDIPDNKKGMQIVNTIISMGHNLGLEVLAEGVEEDVQRRFLELRGCNYYQGYLTSKPVSAEAFEATFLNRVKNINA